MDKVQGEKSVGIGQYLNLFEEHRIMDELKMG